MPRECERARQWASADLDGELSAFERILLEGHVATCAGCKSFRASMATTARMLRAAPLEPLEARIELRRAARRLRFRLAPAVAAMAVCAVGLGSLLASSVVRPGTAIGSPVVPAAPPFRGPSLKTGPINLTVLRAFRRAAASRVPAVDTSKVRRLARGGVVLK